MTSRRWWFRVKADRALDAVTACSSSLSFYHINQLSDIVLTQYPNTRDHTMTHELMRCRAAVSRSGAGSERKEQTVFKYACSRFTKLPVELVESILASLDTPDILNGKLVRFELC